MAEQKILLSEALDFYTAAGFAVFPLNGKIPIKAGWPQTPYQPEVDPVEFSFGNFGILLTETDLVIDIDPRNFKDTVDSWLAFTEFYKLPLTSPTLVVLTGSGGRHIYYKKPADLAICGSIKAYPGVEFKTKGQYVVGAGSIHPETRNQYKFISKTAAIAQSPLELLKIIEKQTQAVIAGAVGVFSEDEQTVKRVSDYLRLAPIAIEGDGGDRTTFAVAARCRDFGLPMLKTLDLMLRIYNGRCLPEWDASELEIKVRNAYSYAIDVAGKASPAMQFDEIEIEKVSDLAPKLRWDKNDKGSLLQGSMNNLLNIFDIEKFPLHGLLALNEFSHRIVFRRPAPWHRPEDAGINLEDHDVLACKAFLSQKFKFEPKTAVIYEAFEVIAHRALYHPVKDYLNSLKWDGVERVKNWLINFMGAEDDLYTRTVGVKFLLGAISRVYEPGCQFEYVLILEGEEGIGKSQAIRALCTPWFSDQPLNLANKDTILNIFGKWIIELGEMETHYRSETAAMTAFLSKQDDTFRIPYGRMSKDFKRQCVFMGTINPERDLDVGYLKKTTGNRRMWPVAVKKAEVALLKKVRDQLWAEALVLYKRGIPSYLEDAKINSLAKDEQRKRLGRDPWHSRVELWLNENPVYRVRQHVRSEDVFYDCIGGRPQQYDRRAMVRIAEILYQLHWEKGVFWSNELKATVRGYKRPVIE